MEGGEYPMSVSDPSSVDFQIKIGSNISRKTKKQITQQSNEDVRYNVLGMNATNRV